MQFRRTAVAVAIAGIAAATPQIASADTVLSGAIGILIGDDDGGSELALGVDGAVVGVVATHQMNNGLDAYGSVRFDGDGFSGSPVSDDNIYLGVKGGFGDIRIGEVPTVAEYGQVSNDIFDVSPGSNAAVAYTGSFGPVSLGLNWSPEANEDLVGVGVKFGIGGFSIGAGAEERSGVNNFSVGASFGFAGASVAAHVAGIDDNGTETEIVGVKVGYGIAGASVSGTFMQQTVDDGEAEEAIRVDVGYGLGGGFDVSARYDIRPDDVQAWRVLFNKSF